MCEGIKIHSLCIFSYKSLPRLIPRLEYFLNKFRLEYDPIAYQCMEEWINNKTELKETIKIRDYCQLPFIRNYTQYVDCYEFKDPDVLSMQ
jgi:hypothetical protein